MQQSPHWESNRRACNQEILWVLWNPKVRFPCSQEPLVFPSRYAILFWNLCRNIIFLSISQQSVVGQGFLVIETSRSHTDVPHSVGLLWTSDQTDAENSTWQHTSLTRDKHPPPPSGGIRTRNPSKQTAQAHAVDRVATGIGKEWWIVF